MAVYHRTVTIGTTATELQTLITDVGNTLKVIAMQADAGNTGIIYIGGKDSTLSSTDYGWRIETPVSSIPYAPSIIELGNPGGVSVGSFQILASATTQKVHCLLVTA